MFKKTETALTNLATAVTEDVTEGVSQAKSTAVPFFAGALDQIAGAFLAAKAKLEGKEPAKKPASQAAPLPNAAENNAILSLRALGKKDEEIAEALGISVLTVKMAVVN